MKSSATYILITLITACITILSACKKDLLHWQKVEHIESGTNDRLNDVYFINDNIGYAVGGSRFDRATLLRTTDWGKSWKYYDFPEAGKGLYGINAAPDGKLYAVGYDGKMMTSTDKGDNWQFTQLGIWKEYKDVAYFTKDNGIIAGGISYGTGYILHIDANGNVKKWDSLKYELNDIAAANTSTAYISGYGVIQKTNDAGKTWHILAPTNDNFTAIHLRNESEIWVCGIAGSIFHTTDGGNNWERLRNGNDITIPKYELLDIYFADGQRGWAVGERGVVIYTEDGGHNWSRYNRFTEETLRSITMSGDGTLITVGDNGRIFKLHLKN